MNIKLNSFKELFADYTIFHGLDTQRINKEIVENKSLTFTQKLKKGAVAGITTAATSTLLIVLIQETVRKCFGNQYFPHRNSTDRSYDFLYRVIKAPAWEELFFRGVLLNAVYFGQKGVNTIAPSCIKKTKTFQWLMSPSCTILLNNFPFLLRCTWSINLP